MLVDLYLVMPREIEGPGIDRLLEACVEAGLDGACLVGQGECPPIEAARRSRFADRLFLAFGVEIPLNRGRLVWIPPDPEVLRGIDGPAFMDGGIEGARALRERHGGALVASHPYDRAGGAPFVDGVMTLRFLDGVMAGSGAADHTRNLMACTAAQRLGVPTLGGTGPGCDPAQVGASATAFVETLSSQEALVQALLSKDAWAVELLARPDSWMTEGSGAASEGRQPPRSGPSPEGRPRGREDRRGRDPGGPSRDRPFRNDSRPRGNRPGPRPPRGPGGPDRGAR